LITCGRVFPSCAAMLTESAPAAAVRLRAHPRVVLEAVPMIQPPSTVEQVVFFVLLVVRGVTYQFLRERWRGPVPGELELGQRVLRAMTASVALDATYAVAFGPWLAALVKGAHGWTASLIGHIRVAGAVGAVAVSRGARRRSGGVLGREPQEERSHQAGTYRLGLHAGACVPRDLNPDVSEGGLELSPARTHRTTCGDTQHRPELRKLWLAAPPAASGSTRIHPRKWQAKWQAVVCVMPHQAIELQPRRTSPAGRGAVHAQLPNVRLSEAAA
jgi:hypothetical protein